MYYTTRQIIADGAPNASDSFMTKTPIWRSIAEELKGAMADGQYPAGAKLPTEAVLADRFGVNRHTVRHAVRYLAEAGLVHSRRGSGVFVLARPLDYPLSRRTRFRQNLLAAGRMPGSKALSVEVVGASEADARRLHVASGDPVAVSHGLAFADDAPVALSESRFPEVRYPGLADALREGQGITKAFETVGITDYTRVSTRLTATHASATQALHLQIAEGAPLIFAESLNRDDRGSPVEHGKTWFASDRITLTLDHEAG